jgi:dTMP kinase
MFITFEGIEGSGKTTQMRRLAERMPDAVVTKEPGGTETGDRIRELLLHSKSKIEPVAEVLLFAASRRQLVMELIRPALAAGRTVLCDRYADSTLAYQGFGRLIDLDRLRSVTNWATDGLKPDRTLLFDLPEEVGLARARSRNARQENDEGRFETEDVRFFRRIREGYLSLAAAEPDRYRVIDGNGTADEVFNRMMEVLA